MYKNGIDFAEQVLLTLNEMQVSTSEENELDFYLYVPTKNDAKACQTKLVEADFNCDIEKSVDEESDDWLCYCTKKLVPTKEILAEAGELFIKLAKDFNGEFDGWEVALDNSFELNIEHMFLEPSLSELAHSILDTIRTSNTYPHEFVTCNPNDFEHLDLDFYQQTEQLLIHKGFKTIADIEDKTISNAEMDIPIITFARTMWHDEHKIMATFFYIEPLGMGFTDLVSVTESKDVIHTTTAPAEYEITTYPKVDSAFFENDITANELLEIHIQRLHTVSSNDDIRFIDIDTIDKVININNFSYKIKSEHLESIGWVTKEYLIAQSGGDEALADNLLAEIKVILTEEKSF